MGLPRKNSPENGSRENGFGDYLRTLVAAHGYSIESLRKEFGIALQRNVLGKERPGPEKIERLISSLQLQTAEAAGLWKKYLGEPQTMRGVLRAAVQRYGYEGVQKRAGGDISTTTLSYMLRGDTRRHTGSSAPHYPPLSTWLTIAQALGMDTEDAREMWKKDTGEYLEQELGRNPLGREVELLFRSRENAGINQWRKHRPASLQNLTARHVQQLISDARQGKLCPWTDMDRLMLALDATLHESLSVISAWLLEAAKLSAEEQQKVDVRGAERARSRKMYNAKFD